MIGRRGLLAGGLVLGALSTGPRPARARQLSADNGVAAKVNGEAISTFDLTQRMRLLVLLSGLKPTEATLAWLQPYALNGLVNDRLKSQEFERFRSLSELDGEVEDQVGRMAGGDPARLLAALDQAQVQPDALRAYLRPQIAWGHLVRGRLGGRVQVSEALAAQEAERLSAPDSAKVRLTGLFVADLSSGGHATGLTMAAQLAAQVQAGADLEALAGTFGDPSPYGAGEAGRWMPADGLETAVAAAATDAPLNALGPPLEVRDGVLLLVVLERYQPGGPGSPPTITPEAAGAQLTADRLTSLASRYLRDLRTSAEIA